MPIRIEITDFIRFLLVRIWIMIKITTVTSIRIENRIESLSNVE